MISDFNKMFWLPSPMSQTNDKRTLWQKIVDIQTIATQSDVIGMCIA